MRLALYLLNYKLFCNRHGFEFNARSAMSVAINYKSFRDTYKDRKNMNHSLRQAISFLRNQRGN